MSLWETAPKISGPSQVLWWWLCWLYTENGGRASYRQSRSVTWNYLVLYKCIYLWKNLAYGNWHSFHGLKKHAKVSLLHYIDIALFSDKIGSLQFSLRWRLSRYSKVAWVFRASQWLIARVWRISRILARGTRSSGSLLLPPPFAFYNDSDLYACLDFQDSALQIKMYYQFEGVFEIVESHRSISICPRHQNAFCIRCSN